MTIKNYIFDFDGTLMDTQSVILSTLRRTIAQLGLPPRTDEQCKAVIGIRSNEAAQALYPELPAFNAEFADMFRRNYEETDAVAVVELFPDVKEVLAHLRQMGCGLSVASSRSRASLMHYLEQQGIAEWFEMIVGADDVSQGKPHPEAVLKVLDAMGWEAETTLMVGDAAVDIAMGNAAGCHTCAVTFGNGSLADLQAENPTMIIDRFRDILV